MLSGIDSLHPIGGILRHALVDEETIVHPDDAVICDDDVRRRFTEKREEEPVMRGEK